MLKEQFLNIQTVIAKTFPKNTGEPAGDEPYQSYILQAMWVMMLSEFEGSIKALVEDYLNKIKEINITEIHPCILITHFSQDIKNNPTSIMNLYEKKPSDITYGNFTKDGKSRQNKDQIVELFHKLGLLFNSDEKKKLDALNSFTQKRNGIAHGNKGVELTAVELHSALKEILEIYDLLKKKLGMPSELELPSPCIPPTLPCYDNMAFN